MFHLNVSPPYLLSALLLALGLFTGATFASDIGKTTALPIPRFVSIKAAPANVRAGPGIDYPLKWTFVRRALPVEIVAEFGNWRRIRDWEGKQGWVFGPLLSGIRTALVAPWSGAKSVSLRSDTATDAPVVAIMQPTVLVRIIRCDGKWCKVKAGTRQGYVRQTKLWGAYPGEVL